jgi:excisionase family DNA binding protein
MSRDNPKDSGLPPLLPSVSFDSRDSSLDRKYRAGDDGMSRLLTVEEVAALLNVPRKWVYQRVGLKPPEGIPHVKVGKYLRFRETDLRDFVERLRKN